MPKSDLVLVSVENGLHPCHYDVVRNAGTGIGDSGLDAGAEPRIIFGGVFRRHQMRRRVEVGLGEGIIVWHAGVIA